MSRADAFICPPDIQKRFAKYMGGKPILLDFYDFIPPKMKQKHPELSQPQLNEKIEAKYAEISESIKAEMKKGKNVALLDYGDPTIWSASEYLMEHFDDSTIEMVSGLSSFNVASSLLKRHPGCQGSVVLASAKGILKNKPMFEAAAKSGATLSIFMAMKEMPNLIEFFQTAYEPGVPVGIVYRAGYSSSEKVVRTDLKGLKSAIDAEKEKDLFLVFLGPCLNASSKAERH